MSSSNNNTYKKTSFLAGSNTEFINEFYADYLSDPKSIPESWKLFFDGLRDDKKLVNDNLNGPSWSPVKKFIEISKSLQIFLTYFWHLLCALCRFLWYLSCYLS